MLPNLDESNLEEKPSINWESLLYKFRFQISLALVGAVLIGFGVLIFKNASDVGNGRVEVLETSTGAQNESLEVVVEIAGAVEKPGVYKLSNDSRIEDVLLRRMIRICAGRVLEPSSTIPFLKRLICLSVTSFVVLSSYTFSR